MRTIWTVGHSTREWPQFLSLLMQAGVEAVADVRRYPASRRHPQFAAAIPNYYQLEMIGSETDRRIWADLLGEALPLVDGCLPVPSAPGYGIELREEALARYPYSPHEGWR